MKIQGIDGMSPDRLQFEIQRGGKLVFYQYAISILVLSFRRSSDIYFIPAGESAVKKGLQWSLISLVEAGGGFRGDRSSRSNRWSRISKAART